VNVPKTHKLAKNNDTQPKQEGEEMLHHFLRKPHLKRKNKNSKFYSMFKSKPITRNYLPVKFGSIYLSLNTKLLLHSLHVLHDATKNQQGLKLLSHEPICFFFNKMCNVDKYLELLQK
jgi:hypothetical protein